MYVCAALGASTEGKGSGIQILLTNQTSSGFTSRMNIVEGNCFTLDTGWLRIPPNYIRKQNPTLMRLESVFYADFGKQT